MRAKTRGKHKMGKRFAIVIGVAAAGVMALGAQTGAQTQAPTPRGQATPTCNGKPATIVGTDGGDDLNGTQGPDVIVDLGGNDFTNGRDGNDVICGGTGADFLKGGHGKDTLLGQAGGDALWGGEGIQSCTHGSCSYKPSKDRCEGGKGIDYTSPVCEVEKSIEKSGFLPPKFH